MNVTLETKFVIQRDGKYLSDWIDLDHFQSSKKTSNNTLRFSQKDQAKSIAETFGGTVEKIMI